MYADLKKESFLYKLSFLILALLPCAIVISTVVMNIMVVLLSISFVTLIIFEKLNLFKKDIFFKILIIFFVFNIVILFFWNNPVNSFSRTFGFVRFILLAYSLSYFISYKEYKYFKAISIGWLSFLYLSVLISFLNFFLDLTWQVFQINFLADCQVFKEMSLKLEISTLVLL